jgi:NAD(P)-dependent dehydrogenase (short-subunit alcohol dehydrogenase family)
MANGPLEGRVVLLTGGTGGLGREAALALADRGASVAIVGRNRERGRETAVEIDSRTGESAGFYAADLASQRSVRRLAETFRSRHDRLDALVNNAGTFRAGREETPDGIEATLAVNHLAPYLLTHRLADLLVEGTPARVVTVASGLHERGRIRFEDLEFERAYDGRAAYAQSKLANVHFARELAARLEGTGTTSNAVDPGFVPATSLAREASPRSRVVLAALARLPLPFVGDVEEGADAIVRAVADPDLEGTTGAYLREGEPAPAAVDDGEVRRRLWDVSAGLVGVSPDAPPLDR